MSPGIRWLLMQRFLPDLEAMVTGLLQGCPFYFVFFVCSPWGGVYLRRRRRFIVVLRHPFLDPSWHHHASVSVPTGFVDILRR